MRTLYPMRECSFSPPRTSVPLSYYNIDLPSLWHGQALEVRVNPVTENAYFSKNLIQKAILDSYSCCQKRIVTPMLSLIEMMPKSAGFAQTLNVRGH